MAGDAGCRAGAQRLSRRLGAVPPARRRRRAIPVAVSGGRQKRPARRGLPSEQSRAALDRSAGTHFIVLRTAFLQSPGILPAQGVRLWTPPLALQKRWSSSPSLGAKAAA